MSSLVRLTAASLIEEQLPLELLAVRANTKRLNTVPEHPFGQILDFYFASEIPIGLFWDFVVFKLHLTRHWRTDILESKLNVGR